MKRVCLYSMHFVLCVLCACTMVLIFSGCSGRNEKQMGVVDKMSDETEKRGYNPQMAFDYDEHEDIEVDDNYVASLCAEAVRELEAMFGPAEFYIKAENSGEDSYTLNIMYNGKVAEFDDDQLQQIYEYIGQEYKEVKLTDINIQSW